MSAAISKLIDAALAEIHKEQIDPVKDVRENHIAKQSLEMAKKAMDAKAKREREEAAAAKDAEEAEADDQEEEEEEENEPDE